MSELRILARPAFRNRDKNPYNWLLYSGIARSGARVDEFTAANAALGRYDIFHVHWPESTFNASLPEAIATTRALLLAIDWQRARGAKIVWTAHNLQAHDRRFPVAEASFWDALIPRLDGFFALSQAGLSAVRARFPALQRREGFVVPHHHYRGEYPSEVGRAAARARLGLHETTPVALFFGRIQEYKNVPVLIRAFRKLEQDLARSVLLVAGKPYDHAAEAAVLSASGGDERIRLDLRFIDKGETQVYFRAADLVVLPYREILNSGSAVLALGFNRPVLLPHGGAGADLRQLLGERWVELYEHLDAARLGAALARAAARRRDCEEPGLAALAPERAVADTLAGYRAILSASLPSARRASRAAEAA